MRRSIRNRKSSRGSGCLVTRIAVIGVCVLTLAVEGACSFMTHPRRITQTNGMRRMPLSTTTTSPRNDNPLFPVHNLRGGSSLNLSPMFDNGPFWKFNQIIIATNLLGFVISVVSGGSHLHLDLLGTGAFALAALPTGLASQIPRVQLSAGFVSLWGTKLASFLFWRALQLKHDARLESTLSTVSGTAVFWFISVLWGIICSLPHSMGATSSLNTPILASPCGIAGAALFVMGILTETTADYQKWMFKKNHPEQFCNVGLWSISQHPNFLGNMMLWSGIFLLNAPALIDPPPEATTNIFQHLWRFKRLAVAALSPLFLYTLFTGQAQGSITNTKELVMQRYGNDPNFLAYTKRVPLIFPNLLKFFQSQ